MTLPFFWSRLICVGRISGLIMAFALPVIAQQQWTRFKGEPVWAGRGYYQDFYYIHFASRRRTGANTYAVRARIEGEGDPQVHGFEVNCSAMKSRWLDKVATNPWMTVKSGDVLSAIAVRICRGN
jgi:hypothetical protein